MERVSWEEGEAGPSGKAGRVAEDEGVRSAVASQRRRTVAERRRLVWKPLR